MAPVPNRCGRWRGRTVLRCLAAVLLIAPARAQENPPPVGAESPGFMPRTPYYPAFYAEEPRDYNLRWGKLTGRLRGSFQTEFNDNINLADENARADVILAPFAAVGFLWPVSDKNLLQFDLGLGYRAYLDNSELNSLLISPDSRLDYQIRVLDAQITVHDQFAIQVDPLSRPELSGSDSVLDYRRFNNEAGVTVNWEGIRGIMLLGGYNYVLDRSLNDDFVELDRDDHVFHLSAYRAFGARINAGLRGSYTISQYVQAIQNDGETLALGPHLIAEIGDFITAETGVSYTRAEYRQTGTIADASDFEGITFFAGAQHRMNSRTSQYLRADRTINPGFGSNFTDIFALQYGISVRAASALTIRGTFVFEDLTSSGTINENSHRYLWYVGPTVRISRAWTAGLAYSFGLKESDFSGRDYTQNRVTLELTRHF